MRNLLRHLAEILARVRLLLHRRPRPGGETAAAALPAAATFSTEVTPQAAPVVAVQSTSAPPEPAEATISPRDRNVIVDAGRPGDAAVRQFFARMAAAGPDGLTVDFTAWGGVPVERFFVALGAPERTAHRGPALAEAASLGEAFDGFVWD